VAAVTELPTGVEADKVGIHGEQYRINGRLAAKKHAIETIEKGDGGQVPDDTKKLRLTIIGTEADQARVLADVNSHAAFASLKDKLLTQDYSPANWALSAGFVTTGGPTIYLQAPDGKVLLRQDSYAGADALAEAIRKADPNYDPTRDPNGKPKPVQPNEPKPNQPSSPIDTSTLLWIGGLAVVLFIFTNRRNP
jgi:hypothetical protein